tara:strand:- start:145 stop:621 length:477 start_codon:yes stop_codon:yes gene_type:complete
MFGEFPICEKAVADQGVLFLGSADFIGTTVAVNVGVGILSGVATITAQFDQTTTAAATVVGSQTLNFQLNQTTAANIVKEAAQSVTSEFSQETNTSVIFSAISSMDYNFTQSTAGNLLWEPVDADTTVESWSSITHTGDTWTEISGSGTTETWTDTVT